MIKKLAIVCLYVLVCLGLHGCVSGPTTQGVAAVGINKSPKDTREFLSISLDNELEVLLIQDASSEIAAVSLALGVGSFQNPPQQQGLAHYLEHMLFLGTEKYPEPNTLQQFIDHNSGRWNAYTAPDHTNYFFSLPVTKLDEAMDMFSDYFKAPLFDLEYSDKERNAVNSEWSMGRSQDGRIINYLNGLTGNPEHPGSQLAVGNLETLSDKPGSILNDELMAFFSQYYSSNIMKLVVVSNKSLEEQELLVRKHFSGIQNKHIAKPTVPVPGMTDDQLGKKIHYASVMDLKMLSISFPMANNQSQWRHKPNEYVINLLASEEPGTVAQQLRERNLVKALYARVDPKSYGYNGSFDIYADLTDEGMLKRDEIIAAIFAYIELIKTQGIEEKYFLEQKAIKEKKFANLEMQQPLDTAIGLSAEMLSFPSEWLIAHPYHYGSFDAKAIDLVLSSMTPERSRIWYIGQHEPAENAIPYFEGAYSLDDITPEDLHAWTGLAQNMTFKLPAENDLFSKDKAEVVASSIVQPKRVKASEGIEGWLSHSVEFQDQKGKFELLFNTDLADKSVNDYVLANLFVKVLKSQNLTLMDRAQQAGISISFSFTGNEFVVSLAEFNAKHDVLMATIMADLATWDVTDEEFAKAKDSLRQDLQNREKAPPFRQMFGLLQRQLRVHGWSWEQEKGVVDSLAIDQLKQFHRNLMSHNRVRVFAYGNYSEQTVDAILASIENNLPKNHTSMPQYRRAYKVPIAGKNIRYNHEVKDHTDNALVHLFIAPEQSVLGEAQMMTLNALTKNSFFTQLRTNEQLGYVVGTAAQTMEDYPGIMFYVQSNTTPLVDIKARIDRFRQEFLAELEATDEAVIEQIKQSQLDKLNKQASDFYEEMQPYLSDFYKGKLTFDSREQLKAAFAQVNKAGLLELYKNIVLAPGGADVLVQLKGSAYKDTVFAE